MIIDILQEFEQILVKLYRNYDWFTLQTPKGSLTNTELFYIYGFIKTIKPKLLFESGVGNGRSTIILSECMKETGNVISANFTYEDDNWNIPSFEDDFPNLEIRNGRGEDIIDTIFGHIGIAVIDGPKPSGDSYGRPGWDKLINIARNKVGILFQHDISDNKNKDRFEMNCHDCQYIQKDFLQMYPMYGAVEEWKQTTPNLGYYKIDCSYTTPWT